MAAIAELSELKAANNALKEAKFNKKQIVILRQFGPKVGWKNLCHMLVYGRTPEDLKTGKRR